MVARKDRPSSKDAHYNNECYVRILPLGAIAMQDCQSADPPNNAMRRICRECRKYRMHRREMPWLCSCRRYMQNSPKECCYNFPLCRVLNILHTSGHVFVIYFGLLFEQLRESSLWIPIGYFPRFHTGKLLFIRKTHIFATCLCCE